MTKKKPAETNVEASPHPSPAASSDGPRKITPRSYVSRVRRTKAARSLARNKLPSAIRIMFRSVRILFRHWNVIGGILAIYTVINLLLIGGFSSSESLEDTRDSLTDVFTGDFSKLSTGLTLFGFMVQSGSSVASGVASAYQSVVLVVVSLAFIWSLRQFHAGNIIRIRDAFYQSTYPLVQVLLVLAMLGIHILPAALGIFLFSTLIAGGILIDVWQQLLVGGLSLLLVLWTLYLLIASVFAVYIATLPEMTPFKALRSAKDIVKHRRGTVFLKLIYLPFVMLVVSMLVMVPLSVFVPNVATVVFFFMTMVSLPLVHSYMYRLYRELINE